MHVPQIVCAQLTGVEATPTLQAHPLRRHV